MSERPSRFGGSGLAFCRGTRELAHFHAGAEVDLRLGRAHVRSLRADPRCVSRPGASDWIAHRLETEADVAAAFELARDAWEGAVAGARPRPRR